MSITNWVRLAIVIIVGLFVQVCVLDELSIDGAHPDVMVVIVAACGLAAGPTRGAAIGFFTGCAADLVVNTPFGLSALTFVLLGFACGVTRFSSSDSRSTNTEVLFCIAAAVCGTLGFTLIGGLIGQPGMFGKELAGALLVVAAGAVVLSPLTLPVTRWAFSGIGGSHSNLAIPSGGSASG